LKASIKNPQLPAAGSQIFSQIFGEIASTMILITLLGV
jgi:hypothetical protein